MTHVNCTNCASVNCSVVRTYKHDWHQCGDCGTVRRERRPSYPLDNFPIRTLINRSILKRLFGATLLRVHEVVAEEKKFYDLYGEVSAKGPEGTKWAAMTPMRLEDFERCGIYLAGKSVLEISGGPGFLAKAIHPIAKRVVVTEFSQSAADGMAESLGIETVKFDYNNDSIDQCVKGEFDVIVIIYSLGFCDDVRAFAQSLRAISHDETVIYVCHSPGSLGLMLRWEFDEYAYTRCREPDEMARCFSEAGFYERIREDEVSYRYDQNWYDEAGTVVGSMLRRIHRVIARYYLARALRSAGRFNRDLIQRSVKQVFGRKPDAPG
jgi:hypothetical protein